MPNNLLTLAKNNNDHHNYKASKCSIVYPYAAQAFTFFLNEESNKEIKGFEQIY